MLERTDVIVIGAGVIGLAVARQLAMSGRSVIVVERHARSGTETSSRNSGVIHSGIYYPPGSSKARLCVRGRDLLYEYCRSRQVPHDNCGKLIVAQAAEAPRLEKLQAIAVRNGVMDLEWLDAAAIRVLEPAVRATAGLWCPSTGIVSAHDLMTAMEGDIEAAGGILAYRTAFASALPNSKGIEVALRSGEDMLRMECAALINSAGLGAPALVQQIEGYPVARIPAPHFAKGSYFEFSGRSPFRHLVYPMPSEAGLGVHGTLDLAGRLRFGPDVEWLDPHLPEFDYTVATERGDSFYAAIREYWPGLPDDSLQPSYSGIRPKLVGPGQPAADFLIEGESQHGVAGLVNLLGMESPGLTSALAIAEEVESMLEAAG